MVRRDHSGTFSVKHGLPRIVLTKENLSLGSSGSNDASDIKTSAAKVVTPTEKRAPKLLCSTKEEKLGCENFNLVTSEGQLEARRRKRKRNNSSASGDISQASAKMLFECSCQLLKTQSLEYDVRARELANRCTMQAKKIKDWETRVHNLKRELKEYADEWTPTKSASGATIEENAATLKASTEQVAAAASIGGINSSLSPAVSVAEAKLRKELHKRTQKINDFYRIVPGFIKSLD
ncbi:hypothetical protein CCR75_008928 [Bremia lactucae]|uniref:Uncharacterized protein n=1 Tax=Bremia lactucae TaxID=4779 RepID=A0A976IL43_BRELC|nr:hypothetical protein CCR75_008928 [Bremia lactucae]